ncbi:response regulator [Leptolyngbya sp. 'hensonii']|uniref:ATP-binding response regulator n=1 Tax=Leptolyngbya sp. 'hensonii' TaxID=1922337 RepID=UPI00094FC9CF|nr:response regulator [Leptolyngbya sp. 'hensonii']OLP16716.1 response regulator [Leptolyngbya sp. 'hensonii']
MKKILVIEDEWPVRTNIIDLLQLEGFEVISASHGQAGIQLAQEQLPDLIICDVMMPKMDGFEVLKTLSQNPSTAAIPLVFLTAKAERKDFRQGMELGAYDYLTKPFTRAELLGAVQAQLKRQEVITRLYAAECEQTEMLANQVRDLQQFNDAQDLLLNNLIQELREPLSNINMAMTMLRQATSEEQRDRYLKVLQEEFVREITLLNQVSELQKFLTPENTKLLRQFNLLQSGLGHKSSDHKP